MYQCYPGLLYIYIYIYKVIIKCTCGIDSACDHPCRISIGKRRAKRNKKDDKLMSRLKDNFNKRRRCNNPLDPYQNVVICKSNSFNCRNISDLWQLKADYLPETSQLN